MENFLSLKRCDCKVRSVDPPRNSASVSQTGVVRPPGPNKLVYKQVSRCLVYSKHFFFFSRKLELEELLHFLVASSWDDKSAVSRRRDLSRPPAVNFNESCPPSVHRRPLTLVYSKLCGYQAPPTTTRTHLFLIPSVNLLARDKFRSRSRMRSEIWFAVRRSGWRSTGIDPNECHVLALLASEWVCVRACVWPYSHSVWPVKHLTARLWQSFFLFLLFVKPSPSCH